MRTIRRIRAAVQKLRPSRRFAQGLISRADQARDRGRFAEAAPLYEEALCILPGHGPIHVQAGHMRKEIGDLKAALAHYRAADELMPDNADLALQLGHFFKRAGEPANAIAAYRKALRLAPGTSDDAIKGIKDIERRMRPAGFDRSDDAKRTWSQALEAGLVPELMPEHATHFQKPRDQIVLGRAGGREAVGFWGELPTIYGIGAVRGYLVSRASFDTVTIALDDVPIRSERPIHNELPNGDIEHIFNIWFDIVGREPKRGTLGISFTKDGLQGPSKNVSVEVAGNLDKPAADERDDIVPAGNHPKDLESWIRTLPSEVRPAISFARGARRSILVLRVDQLGDLIVSVPALKRLRNLAGGAKLVGLLTPDNADLARSLNLFDDVLVVPFPLNVESRERVMSADDQAALRTLLQAYRFDAAIDLGTSHMSRPLLVLSGAPDLYGVETGLWAWLDARLNSPAAPSSDTRVLPHSERLMQIVEQFGADVGAIAARPILLRAEDDCARLARHGLTPRRYVVLHESISHKHNQWPGFAELLQLQLAATTLDIAFLTDAPGRAAAFKAFAGCERIRLFDSRLAFDDLDALLANATAFAGIDSGPKHLSALRGVPVVSIHSSRSDWREWGQEQTGLIVSRRLPCAGCGIGHHDDACGKNYACIVDIHAEEVHSCILSLLARNDAGNEAGPDPPDRLDPGSFIGRSDSLSAVPTR